MPWSEPIMPRALEAMRLTPRASHSFSRETPISRDSRQTSCISPRTSAEFSSPTIVSPTVANISTDKQMDLPSLSRVGPTLSGLMAVVVIVVVIDVVVIVVVAEEAAAGPDRTNEDGAPPAGPMIVWTFFKDGRGGGGGGGGGGSPLTRWGATTWGTGTMACEEGMLGPPGTFSWLLLLLLLMQLSLLDTCGRRLRWLAAGCGGMMAGLLFGDRCCC